MILYIQLPHAIMQFHAPGENTELLHETNRKQYKLMTIKKQQKNRVLPLFSLYS